MPGINVYEFFILILLAFVLLGPERLPQYAQALARWVKKARAMAQDAKVRFKEETGTDFDEVDWQKYDPRRYDPRRIIREALAEEYDVVKDARSLRRSVDPRELFAAGSASEKSAGASTVAAGVAGASAGVAGSPRQAEQERRPAPFDPDAT
ncbi:hypothetical protein [Nesterenkonia sp.]|uniref:hypothetical protein n=1 Tax=Nesterenkonia sp. TaxID=704201 RepID=UPI002626409F|nr:hypothetical protein [Nesterenkonia sp.]